MKKTTIRVVSAILTAILIIALALPLSAAPTTYSKALNSGTRHELCNTLDGTSAQSYYGSAYSYANLASKSSSELFNSLRTLMTSTHSRQTSYSDCRDYGYKTDCQKENSKVTLIYTSFEANQSDFSGSAPGWNREHVWPKSLGGFNQSGAGSDLHHIRPSDVTTNSIRGNDKYGNVNGGSAANGSSLVGGMSGGTRGGGYFEPHDNVKGDVARICLYVYARWGKEFPQCSSITNVFQSVDVLLEWCALDPVDTWEMGRNEVVQSIQGNRNVFIDYPEYAWLIFGKEVPKNMTTPSGMASNGSNPPPSVPTTPEDTTTPPTPPITPTPSTSLDSSKQYTMSLVQATLGKTLYFNGSMDGYYLAVTEKESEAVLITPEASGDGYKLSFTIGGAKKYIDLYDRGGGKAGVQLSTSTSTVFKYSENAKTFVVTISGADYYLGTYGTYKTFSASSVNYITGSNAANVGITQFPAVLTPTTEDETTPVPDTTKTPETTTSPEVTTTPPEVTTTPDSETKAPEITTTPTDDTTNAPTVDTTTAPSGDTTTTPSGDTTTTPIDDTTKAPDACTHANTETRNAVSATCSSEGYTGDKYCTDCGEKTEQGKVIAKNSSHDWLEWTVFIEPTEENDGSRVRKCALCGTPETETIPALGTAGGDNNTVLVVVIVCVAVLAVGAAATVVIIKKKK